MKQHRLFTFLGAGSILAACVALAALLISPNGQSTVEAATIFQSFRESIRKAFTLQFENIVGEGYRVDGDVLVVLADDSEPGFSHDSVISANFKEEGLYIGMRIRSRDEEPDQEKLDVEFALATAPENEWLYLQSHDVPGEWVSEHPMLANIAVFARKGVLVGLDGLFRHGGSFLSIKSAQDKQSEGDAAEDQTKVSGHIKFGLKVGTDDEATDSSESDSGAGSSFTLDFSTDKRDEPADGDAEHPEQIEREEQGLQAAADSLGIDTDQMAYATEILNNMFAGRMTREQLASMISWIESSAGDVSVDDRGDGLYVLNARQFDLSDLPIDAEAAGELADIALEIGYREESGVEWVALINVGETDGKLTFEFVDRDVGDPVFDRQRYLDDDDTFKFDLGSLFKQDRENSDDADE